SFGTGGSTIIPFGTDDSQDDNAYGVTLQRDGKIVVVGTTRNQPNDIDFAVARLNPDGKLDSGFGTDGRVVIPFNIGGSLHDEARDVLVQPDGKIVVSGSARIVALDNDFAVVRLMPDGKLDSSFGKGGKTTIPFNRGGDNDDKASGVVLQPDGKLVLGGFAQIGAGLHYAFAAARLNSAGTLDAGFGIGGKTTISFVFDGAINHHP